MILTYSIREAAPYINWIYFFHAWGFQRKFSAIAGIHGCDGCRASWLTAFPEEERPKASEATQLFKEANRMLNLLDGDYKVRTVYRFFDANSDGDNIIINGSVFPLLRQQNRKQPDDPFLCLSDFVRPLSSEIKDTVGAFATSVDGKIELLYENDPYKRLLAQTLADRLAEAATEMTYQKLQKEKQFEGIRPAVGYPTLPDQSVNFLLNELLSMDEIGISLTENGAMSPHASTSGLIFMHPAAKYFAVGKIGEDQLKDYARRRRMDVETMKKFLAANI